MLERGRKEREDVAFQRGAGGFGRLSSAHREATLPLLLQKQNEKQNETIFKKPNFPQTERVSRVERTAARLDVQFPWIFRQFLLQLVPS